MEEEAVDLQRRRPVPAGRIQVVKTKKEKKTARKDNVVNLTEARDLVQLIDKTFGGKLGTFRCYLPAEPGPAREAVLRARRLSSDPAAPPPDDTAPTAPK